MRLAKRRPRFLGGIVPFIDFFLPAHITGLACSMLLYSNDQLGPIALAAAIGIASKHLLCVKIGNGMRHFYNPRTLASRSRCCCSPGSASPRHTISPKTS